MITLILAAILPLSPLTFPEQEPYSGAGCMLRVSGRTLMITDLTRGVIKVSGRLVPLRANGIFDPDKRPTLSAINTTLRFVTLRRLPASEDGDNRRVRIIMNDTPAGEGVLTCYA